MTKLYSTIAALVVFAPLAFAIVFAALYHAEAILSARDAARAGQHLAAKQLTGYSLVVTALLCAAGLYVWRDASDAGRGAWVIMLAVATATIGFILPRVASSLRDLAIGYRAQAAALLVVAVPVASTRTRLAVEAVEAGR